MKMHYTTGNELHLWSNQCHPCTFYCINVFRYVLNGFIKDIFYIIYASKSLDCEFKNQRKLASSTHLIISAVQSKVDTDSQCGHGQENDAQG